MSEDRDDRFLQFNREWLAVQACEGNIVDMATPEERAAREIAVAEECRRLWEAEQEAAPVPPGHPFIGANRQQRRAAEARARRRA